MISKTKSNLPYVDACHVDCRDSFAFCVVCMLSFIDVNHCFRPQGQGDKIKCTGGKPDGRAGKTYALESRSYTITATSIDDQHVIYV